jgi:hypothetical protein
MAREYRDHPRERLGISHRKPICSAIVQNGVVPGTLSLRQGGRLHLISSKDRRLGNQIMVLRVPARLSASDGVAESSGRLFSREIPLWHRGTNVLVLMSKVWERVMLAAVGEREEH